MMIGYFSVVLCFICHFYHICWKNLSKRPAVEPSVFWEIRTIFQKKSFFLCCFFTFAFFVLFHIFVDFRLPLPPPLAQVGPICDRFWSRFCSVLVEVGERSRFLEPFETHAANKTHTHTHHNPTTPQPHNPTNPQTHKPTNPQTEKPWPGGMRACALSPHVVAGHRACLRA